MAMGVLINAGGKNWRVGGSIEGENLRIQKIFSALWADAEYKIPSWFVTNLEQKFASRPDKGTNEIQIHPIGLFRRENTLSLQTDRSVCLIKC